MTVRVATSRGLALDIRSPAVRPRLVGSVLVRLRGLGPAYSPRSIEQEETQMKRRLLTSFGAATILASVLAATPLRVSADAGAQFQRSDDGGPEETAANPCLPAKPNPVIGDSIGARFLPAGLSAPAHPGARAQGRPGVRPDGIVLRHRETRRSSGERRDFRGFLDSQITPRFPDGLTVVKGDGQFSDSGETSSRRRRSS